MIFLTKTFVPEKNTATFISFDGATLEETSAPGVAYLGLNMILVTSSNELRRQMSEIY